MEENKDRPGYTGAEGIDDGNGDNKHGRRGLVRLCASLLLLVLLVVSAIAVSGYRRGPSGTAGGNTGLAEANTGTEQTRLNQEGLGEATLKGTEGTEATPDAAGGTSDGTEGRPEGTEATPDAAGGTSEGTEGRPEGTEATSDAAGGTLEGIEGTPEESEGMADAIGGTPERTEEGTEETSQERTEPVNQDGGGTAEERAREYISQMSLEEKVAGLFFVNPEVIGEGISVGGDTEAILNRYAVGGVIYFENNIGTEAQLTQMLAQTREYSKYPVFLAVDEEGGRVARVAQSFDSVENTGSASELGKKGDPKAAYRAYGEIGTYLGRYGFDVDFAPVADIYNESNSMFEQRSFGKDARSVADYVFQAVKGLEDKGVSACAKHFPGHGSTEGDSHTGLAVSRLTEQELLDRELLPFKSAISAGTDFIMMGHISLPNVLGNDTPATLSPEIVTGLLREKLGYNGIIITDAMRMSAVTRMYGASEAAVMAVRAGCDMVLMPEDFEAAYNGVLDAVKSGEIPQERIEESLMRIYRVKCRDK